MAASNNRQPASKVFVFVGQRFVPMRHETICERQRVLTSLVSICLGQRDQGTGAMTVTQICILAWAILGLVVVAILLRGRRDERRREASD